LLAGYDGYPGQRMLSLLEQGRFGVLFGFARSWGEWPGREGKSAWRALVGQLLPDGLYQRGLAHMGINTTPAWMDLGALQQHGISVRPRRMDRLPQGRRRRVAEVLSLALTENGLPSLLRYGDRNAMRFSIENRVPFLTLPMVDLLLSLPEAYLISNSGDTKHVFRAAMRSIVPDAILDRKDKIGFETPMQDWLSDLAPTIRECLVETKQVSFLRSEKMVSDFDSLVSKKRRLSSQIWRMINLNWWSRLFNVG